MSGPPPLQSAGVRASAAGPEARPPASIAVPGRDWLLALAVMAVWGSNFVVIKWGLAELPPFLLATLRFGLAAVPLVFVLPRPPVGWGNLAAYGVLIGVGQFGLLFLAMRGLISPGLASLVVQLQAFFTMGLALLLAGERPRRYQVVALGIALALQEDLLDAFGNLSTFVALEKVQHIDMAQLLSAASRHLLEMMVPESQDAVSIDGIEDARDRFQEGVANPTLFLQRRLGLLALRDVLEGAGEIVALRISDPAGAAQLGPEMPAVPRDHPAFAGKTPAGFPGLLYQTDNERQVGRRVIDQA